MAMRPFTSPTIVSGGLTLTGCSGTPTDTEVVRWRLLLGACCGVEFLVNSVAVDIFWHFIVQSSCVWMACADVLWCGALL